jgi:hypothetical protein
MKFVVSSTKAVVVVVAVFDLSGFGNFAPTPTIASRARNKIADTTIHSDGEPLDPWPEPYSTFSGDD